MDYSIDFVIPQGPTGPTGATEIVAYGGKYNSGTTEIDISSGETAQIPLASTMPSLNIDYNTQNAIVINQAGVYEINYFCNISTNVSRTVTVALRNNGTNINETVITRGLNDDYYYATTGSVILNLDANSTIDMAISLSSSATLTLGNNTSASITVKKLS